MAFHLLSALSIQKILEGAKNENSWEAIRKLCAAWSVYSDSVYSAESPTEFNITFLKESKQMIAGLAFPILLLFSYLIICRVFSTHKNKRSLLISDKVA